MPMLSKRVSNPLLTSNALHEQLDEIRKRFESEDEEKKDSSEWDSE
jgi:hypothetical protein